MRLSINTFCTAADALDLTRIMIIGDSLGFELLQSIWGLISGHGDAGPRVSQCSHCPRGFARFGVNRSISCNSSRNVQLRYIDNDLLSSHQTPGKLGACTLRSNYSLGQRTLIGSLCMPWAHEYLEDERPTLLLLMGGAHIHTVRDYEAVIDDVFAWLSATGRPKDVRLAATLVPGHADCAKAVEPLRMATSPTSPANLSYGWELFPSYNAHLRAVAHKASMAVLDVASIGSLRPDGHKGAGDCLHYWLPGVPDWYSHMLVTQLLWMAEQPRGRVTRGSQPTARTNRNAKSEGYG